MNSGKWDLGIPTTRFEITKWLVTIHITYYEPTWWRDEMYFSRTFEWEDQDYGCGDKPWPRYFQEHAL